MGKALIALAAASTLAAQEGERYVPWLLERLESADPAIRHSSYTALLVEPGAVGSALRGFASASSLGRELRAMLLFERGESAHVAAVPSLLGDPNPKVRELLLRFLSRKDLSAESEPARVEALFRAAREEDASFSPIAIEGLSGLEHASASRRLLDLSRGAIPARVRAAAVEALARWAGSARELLELAADPGPDRSLLPPVLRALGNRGEKGSLTVLARYRDDPDPRLLAAARQGFSLLQWRLVQRQELGEAAAAYRVWNLEGSTHPDGLFEEAQFHLLHTGDLARSVEAARRLEAAGAARSDREAMHTQARILFHLAVIDLLRRDGVAADRRLLRGIGILEGLEPEADSVEEPEVGYQIALLAGKGRMLRAIASLLGLPGPAADGEREIRAAYLQSLEAQRLRNVWFSAQEKREGRWSYNLDDILSGDLGFFTLASGPVLRDLGREAAEGLWIRTGEILSRLYPFEFVPLPPAKAVRVEPPEDLADRLPSIYPRVFADFCADEVGDSRRAAEILAGVSEVWRGRLNSVPGFAREIARAEFRLGSIHMDLRQGEEAARVIQRAIGLLEDFGRYQEVRVPGGMPDLRLPSELASAYVSLAVNENVVRRRPAEARAYLEKAYALEPSPFNQILLACYHARAGERESARRALSRIEPEPSLFYNMACTFALLGERAQALSFLERHFQVAIRSPGERARGVEWARNDPDLESLRGDPRFEALLESQRKAAEAR